MLTLIFFSIRLTKSDTQEQIKIFLKLGWLTYLENFHCTALQFYAICTRTCGRIVVYNRRRDAESDDDNDDNGDDDDDDGDGGHTYARTQNAHAAVVMSIKKRVRVVSILIGVRCCCRCARSRSLTRQKCASR